MSVIASQQAITASPISAAMAAMIGLMAPLGSLFNYDDCVAATVDRRAMGAIATFNKGRVKDDPEYQRRLAEGY
nr:anaerobic C4-dicarboxylate transporter family protein [Salmonella enterica]